MKTLNVLSFRKPQAKSIWLTIAWAVALLVLFLLVAGCEKEESSKCGQEIIDNTGYVPVTKADLNAGSGTYGVIAYYYDEDADITTLTFSRRSVGGVCTKDENGSDLREEASAWIYAPIWPIPDLTVTGHIERPNLGRTDYTFTISGAGVNEYHYLGTNGWMDLSDNEQDNEFISRLILRFESKENKTADIDYVVDSLKLELNFKAFYAKPK